MFFSCLSANKHVISSVIEHILKLALVLCATALEYLLVIAAARQMIDERIGLVHAVVTSMSSEVTQCLYMGV